MNRRSFLGRLIGALSLGVFAHKPSAIILDSAKAVTITLPPPSLAHGQTFIITSKRDQQFVIHYAQEQW